MSIDLTKEEKKAAVASIQRYFREELEIEINEMRAGFLVNYILSEMAPLAYNRGVRDAENFFRARIDDLPGACFEEEWGYWRKQKKVRSRQVKTEFGASSNKQEFKPE